MRICSTHMAEFLPHGIMAGSISTGTLEGRDMEMKTHQTQFHPDYGLTDEIRYKVLEAFRGQGLQSAMTVGRVSRSTVYRWKSKMEARND